MRSIQKFCWACVLLCITLSGKAAERHRADSLFAAGKYDLAALEYERAYFLDTAAAAKVLARLGRSYCKKLQGDYNGAYNCLSQLALDGLPDSLHHKVRQERALDLYLLSDYEGAAYELQQMEFFIHDSLLTSRSLFLKVLVLTEQEKWEEAEKETKKYLQYKKADTSGVEELFQRKGIRSQKKARLLSFLFPGMGQLYAGRPGAAAIALLLQGAAATFAVISIVNGYYLEGIFTGTSLFMRFYTGGARYASRLIKERNDKVNKAVKDKIKARLTAVENDR